MSFTNVHNEFKTKLRKTGGDFIVHSSDVTLHSSQFILHSSHFTLPSFLKWLNIYEPPHDKTNNVAVRSVKTQISLGIHAILLVLSWGGSYTEIRKTSKFRLHSSYVTVHTSHFTLHSFLKRYFMYKRQLKVPFQSSQFMYGWFAVSHPIQQYCISIISGRWKGEHKKLCAMKRRLG